MDFYKGFIVLYHSSTILLVTSTSFCLFNKFRDFLNLSIKSTVFKICNNQHTQGITLYIGSLKTTSLSCIHKKTGRYKNGEFSFGSCCKLFISCCYKGV